MPLAGGQNIMCISIHAPYEGATGDFGDLALGNYLFQSTLPMRERRVNLT